MAGGDEGAAAWKGCYLPIQTLCLLKPGLGVFDAVCFPPPLTRYSDKTLLQGTEPLSHLWTWANPRLSMPDPLLSLPMSGTLLLPSAGLGLGHFVLWLLLGRRVHYTRWSRGRRFGLALRAGMTFQVEIAAAKVRAEESLWQVEKGGT